MEPVFERRIDLGSLPVIRSHVIDGHAVLPMALILEWLAEGALHRHPGLVAQAVENLRLFKGVVLRDHRPSAVSIRVGKGQRRGESFIVPVEMRGVLESGREVTHARGEVIVADRHSPGERLVAEAELLPLAADREEIYRRVLFHGPAMQAIQQVEGCNDQTIAAWVSTSPPPASWMERPFRQTWLTDPLAIDAAFQLLVLWTRKRLGSSSLPTGVGAYRQFRKAFPAEGVRRARRRPPAQRPSGRGRHRVPRYAGTPRGPHRILRVRDRRLAQPGVSPQPFVSARNRFELIEPGPS